MTAWMVIVAVGAGSYVLRALPVVLDGRWTSTARFERAVGHAGTAALGALVAAGLRAGSVTPRATAASAVAAAVALLVAWRGGSMPRVLLAGAGAYAAVSAGLALLT